MTERQKYIEYVVEFDKNIKSGEIFEEDGAFYEKTPQGGQKRLVGRLTYSEWLLEKILLSLTLMQPISICPLKEK